MISHEHKCIFIHISKCAGSSVEKAFGIDISNNGESNYGNLFGWNNKHNIFLQHATPQQLLDSGLITKKVWDEYYKFLIVRNPWDRAYSDYLWLKKDSGLTGKFKDFLNGENCYFKVMHEYNMRYRGDHLRRQVDYLFLNGERINYDNTIRFENLQAGYNKVRKDLFLNENFFDLKINFSDKRLNHYSHFYNFKRKTLVEKVYKEDIETLNYNFIDRKSLFQKILSLGPSESYLN